MAKDFATGESLPFVKYLQTHLEASKLAELEPLIAALEGRRIAQGLPAGERIEAWAEGRRKALWGKDIPIPSDAHLRRAGMLRYANLLIKALGEGDEKALSLFKARFPFFKGPLRLVRKLGIGVDEEGNLYFPHLTYHSTFGDFQLVNIKRRTREAIASSTPGPEGYTP